MADETTGGSSFDGNVTVKQVGSIPVNSRVTTDEQTWGIPVDVNTSHRSYIKHAAMHLFAAAPLIECDDKGNIKYVPEAKVHQIAKECIKDAYILHDELHAYKKNGSGSGDGSGSGSGSGSGGSGSDDSGLSNKTKSELIDDINKLNGKINDLEDDKLVSNAYNKLLEDQVKINGKYAELLEEVIKDNGLTSKLPTKPSDPSKITDVMLPTKPTIDDVKPKPDDPDKPSEDTKYPISQIENVVKSN